MTKRMLIDATHAEETRVVVLDGNRLEDFDVETSTKRQLKGNIYLAKVVRVEPSLQAAFVEYGGNRHGFLAFSEIHPDYYQIPVADRQRLIDMEAEEARQEEEEEDRAAQAAQGRAERTQDERAGRQEPEPPAQAHDAEPEAVAETADESGVTATIAPPAEAGAGAEAGAEGGAGTQSGAGEVSPAAETAGEPGAVTEAARAAEGGEADEPDASDESRAGTRPAQPLIIESDTRRGPIEPDEDTSDATGEAPVAEPVAAQATTGDAASSVVEAETHAASADAPRAPGETGDDSGAAVAMFAASEDTASYHDTAAPHASNRWESSDTSTTAADERDDDDGSAGDTDRNSRDHNGGDHDIGDTIPESLPPETVGGEPDGDERGERRMPSRFMRNYKIQEVIKRRQILLVQVVKEERGTKGAALTTYLSLAGRFCVLMPNSPRGGGISRKITSATDRRRLKDIMTELEIPKGMGLIVRTAGANRPKPEIKRDCEYLLRLWDDIREHTMKSVAPALIYEEASLIKRAIRDVYSRDVDEILVDGESGWHAAHEFMRMLMPSHAKKVQLWRDQSQPLFARSQVEAQLDAMLLPTVQLRSGGYLVINQTEALVAIDVNSGRSTRERNVEETALRTNLEAADEAARQLRLRDLAGLIVIDFIDMESKKHNAMVERRMKDALKNDRARIQLGHISHFGLLEMSRQRLRPSLAETSFVACPHCGGMGHVRSTESAAIHVLRGIEEEGSKRRAAEVVVHVATPIALYILNHKRDRMREIELRYGMRVTLSGDDRQIEPQFRIDRLRPQIAGEVATVITPDQPQVAFAPPEPLPAEEVNEAAEEEDVTDAEDIAEAEPAREGGAEETAEEAERRRRRRRRRRRGPRRDEPVTEAPAEAAAPAGDEPSQPAAAETETQSDADLPIETHIEGVPEHMETPGEDDDGRGRRRGRRGGRRRRREPGDGEPAPYAAPDAEQPDLPPIYTGPTPANPFGGHAFDIFDVLEQAEAGSSRSIPIMHAPMPEPEVTVTPPADAETIQSEPMEMVSFVNTAGPEPVMEQSMGAVPSPEAGAEETVTAAAGSAADAPAAESNVSPALEIQPASPALAANDTPPAAESAPPPSRKRRRKRRPKRRPRLGPNRRPVPNRQPGLRSRPRLCMIRRRHSPTRRRRRPRMMSRRGRSSSRS